MTKEIREISNIPITIKVKYDGNKLPVSDGILGAIMPCSQMFFSRCH